MREPVQGKVSGNKKGKGLLMLFSLLLYWFGWLVFLLHRCRHCGELLENAEKMVMCSHKRGLVHHECCVSDCSLHGAPCRHCRGVYLLSESADGKE